MRMTFDQTYNSRMMWQLMPQPKAIEVGGYVFPIVEVKDMKGAALIDTTGKAHGLTRQQDKEINPSLPKGENMQDGSGKDEVEKRSGKGEDNKGGECL